MDCYNIVMCGEICGSLQLEKCKICSAQKCYDDLKNESIKKDEMYTYMDIHTLFSDVNFNNQQLILIKTKT